MEPVLVTETDLRSIDRLWLREKDITTLESGDFSGLSNLQYLNLARNELARCPTAYSTTSPGCSR